MKIEEAYQLAVNAINDLRDAGCTVSVYPSPKRLDEEVVLENSGPENLPVSQWNIAAIDYSFDAGPVEKSMDLLARIRKAEEKLTDLGISFNSSEIAGDTKILWHLDDSFEVAGLKETAAQIELVPDPLNPPVHVLIKLGSIIVHMEEKISSRGHWMDQSALDTVRNDPAVIEWLDKMTKMAFLPVKR